MLFNQEGLTALNSELTRRISAKYENTNAHSAPPIEILPGVKYDEAFEIFCRPNGFTNVSITGADVLRFL